MFNQMLRIGGFVLGLGAVTVAAQDYQSSSTYWNPQGLGQPASAGGVTSLGAPRVTGAIGRVAVSRAMNPGSLDIDPHPGMNQRFANTGIEYGR